MTFAAAKFGIAESYALPWMNDGELPSLRGATGWLNSKGKRISGDTAEKVFKTGVATLYLDYLMWLSTK
jgi:hypothetical protein